MPSPYNYCVILSIFQLELFLGYFLFSSKQAAIILPFAGALTIGNALLYLQGGLQVVCRFVINEAMNIFYI